MEFLVVSKEHFDLDYYGGPGLKYTTKVSGENALVKVSSYINEEAKKAETLTRVTLTDAEGRVVAEAEGSEVVLKVKNVHL